MEETDGAPEGYDHATSARIEQPVECSDCGKTIPAGDWLWLFSQGEVEAAEEVKVVCERCAEAVGCTREPEIDTNGA